MAVVVWVVAVLHAMVVAVASVVRCGVGGRESVWHSMHRDAIHLLSKEDLGESKS